MAHFQPYEARCSAVQCAAENLRPQLHPREIHHYIIDSYNQAVKSGGMLPLGQCPFRGPSIHQGFSGYSPPWEVFVSTNTQISLVNHTHPWIQVNGLGVIGNSAWATPGRMLFLFQPVRGRKSPS